MATEDRNEDRADDADEMSASGDYVEGDEARDAYPNEVAAALQYAADNKYDYGPKLRDADLQWDVNRAEPLEGGITRVFVDYTPSTSFRGSSGSEYFDVDASGAVQARRQISVPRQNLPVVLIALTVVSLLSLAVVEVLLWANPFESGPVLYVAGRTLWIRRRTAGAPAVRCLQRAVYRGRCGPMGYISRRSRHRDRDRRDDFD